MIQGRNRTKLSLVFISLANFCLGATTASEESHEAIQVRLHQSFDHFVDDIKSYEERVAEECAIFPEAELFPYVLPALAYGNLALKNPDYSNTAVHAMERLIRPAIDAFEKKIFVTPEGNILQLDSYADYGTELGQINLALALYKTIGGENKRLLETHLHLNTLLYRALETNQGQPIFSYPNLKWPFDTLPCLVSLLLSDPQNESYRKVAEAHLEWIEQEGLHRPTGLPYGEMTHKIPRGCDLSLRLPLMRHFAPEQAHAYYEQYATHHWAGLGFREWPQGEDARIDLDSGPIINGIGLTATGNGLATVLAFGDGPKKDILFRLLAQRDRWVALYQSNTRIRKMLEDQFEKQFVPIDTDYFTGFLYGDAALFYMLTWEDYGLK